GGGGIGHAQQAGRTRTVVVGAVVDAVTVALVGDADQAAVGDIAGRQLGRPLLAVGGIAQADVVEVGAKDDVLVLQHRVAALELGDHILAVVMGGAHRHVGGNGLGRGEAEAGQLFGRTGGIH